MAWSPHRRSADQNALRHLAPQNRCGEPPRRARNEDLARMSPEDQKRRVAELLEFAASIKVPEAEDDGSRTAIDSFRAGRRPWTRLTAPDQTRVR